MFVRGDFYLADTDEDEEAIIEAFYEHETHDVLLIVDEYNRIERWKEMRGDMAIGVTWLTADSTTRAGQKDIYINEAFNEMARNFVMNNECIVAFF
jgi:hypothetical protein